jgi:hypothetical protein
MSKELPNCPTGLPSSSTSAAMARWFLRQACVPYLALSGLAVCMTANRHLLQGRRRPAGQPHKGPHLLHISLEAATTDCSTCGRGASSLSSAGTQQLLDASELAVASAQLQASVLKLCIQGAPRCPEASR